MSMRKFKDSVDAEDHKIEELTNVVHERNEIADVIKESNEKKTLGDKLRQKKIERELRKEEMKLQRLRKESAEEAEALKEKEEIETYIDAGKYLELKSKKIDILLKKKKVMLGKGYDLAEFKEPVLILIRRDLSAEFFEDVRPGKYEIEHSDKEVGNIYISLPPSKLIKFPYGPKQFRGYIMNEDEFLPYPHDVLLNGETVRIVVDKTLNDIKKWKAEEKRAFGDMIFKIAMGAAALIAVYAFYKMLAPQPTIVDKAVTDIAVKAAENVSLVMQNATQVLR